MSDYVIELQEQMIIEEMNFLEWELSYENE